MEPERPDHCAETPSKSQLKRDAQALLRLCREIIALPQGKLAKLPLDPDLVREIEFARGIRSNVARKRQVQFIAKMMRNRDVNPLLEALEALKGAARQLSARHHRAEAWRDKLVSGGDAALQELLGAYETRETQSLRQLARNAQREARADKPPAAARKLFRLLRDMDAERALPPAAG